MTSEKENTSNVNDNERWASLIGGGALVLYGLSQRSLRGVLVAIAGGGLADRGVSGGTPAQSAENMSNIKVEKTVTIDKSPEELFACVRFLKAEIAA